LSLRAWHTNDSQAALSIGRQPLGVGAEWHRPAMTNRLLLRGIELRYVLTTHLALHGPMTLPDLIEDLEYLGFGFDGRASKAVSDALRWEVKRDRVRRLRRGRYGPGEIPRSTEQHIQKRVYALRMAASKARGDDAFWDSLGA
jgi:hypothetical protein